MHKNILKSFIILLIILLIYGIFYGSNKFKPRLIIHNYYFVGNKEDVVKPTSPSLVLMGGGTDVDEAFKWMIERSGGGDFVIIRARGTDAYNQYIYELGKVDSVETLIIKSKLQAQDSFLVNKIKNAEALFIAGGDQSHYVKYWKGTPVENALHYLRDKGVPIGGTSAGLAILGEFLFSAKKGTVYSSEALSDPYNKYIILERDFLRLPYMDKAITDSHFAQRDRMGRIITFMARIITDGWASEVKGIGIDEATALLIDEKGLAIVKGRGSVYFLRNPGPPQRCIAQNPLTFLDIPVCKVSESGSFDLATWRGICDVSYFISAINGVLYSTREGGKIY